MGLPKQGLFFTAKPPRVSQVQWLVPRFDLTPSSLVTETQKLQIIHGVQEFCVVLLARVLLRVLLSLKTITQGVKMLLEFVASLQAEDRAVDIYSNLRCDG